MPGQLPVGLPVPADGTLPESARGGEGFSLYVHIPFCAVRCGYCDFNTYTASELGGGGSQAEYADMAIREIDFARAALERSGITPRPLDTVFFGGGTPTLLPAPDLARILRHATDIFGTTPGAEITTEANPDTVDERTAHTLAEAGFTRMSIGMQSSRPHVLKVLDRTHNPANVPTAVSAARAAGLHTSVDLIYGTPGETLADWQASLDAALACAPDHISAYALIIEEGTRLAARIRRGELPAPDDDDQADKYELADRMLTDAGYHWYEVSNWALPGQQCRHNIAYWQGRDWWGIGPGAHSHVGGVRWWNVKHPTAYASRLTQGSTPAHGREILTAEQRRDERVLLQSRLATGLPTTELDPPGRTAVAGLIADGLVEPTAALHGHVVLTLRGRLLADAVVHRLL